MWSDGEMVCRGGGNGIRERLASAGSAQYPCNILSRLFPLIFLPQLFWSIQSFLNFLVFFLLVPSFNASKLVLSFGWGSMRTQDHLPNITYPLLYKVLRKRTWKEDGENLLPLLGRSIPGNGNGMGGQGNGQGTWLPSLKVLNTSWPPSVDVLVILFYWSHVGDYFIEQTKGAPQMAMFFLLFLLSFLLHV